MSFRRRVLTVCEYLDPAPGDLILDAGCGEGLSPLCSSTYMVCRVVGLDAELRDPKSWNIEEEGRRRDSWLIGDATRLPFSKAVFDGVVCSEVLEHLDDDLAAVRELGRVLKPGGTLAVTVPCLDYSRTVGPTEQGPGIPGTRALQPGKRILGGLWLFICGSTRSKS